MSGVARLVFEVPGSPRGKGRHRSFAQKGKVIHVSDQETVSYEAQVKWFARQAMGAHGLHELLDGPLWLQVTAFTPPSKAQAKAMAKEPNRMHYSTVKPDFDNIGKIVGDALNGLVYRDDAIIADGRVVKRLDERTRIVVSIGQLTD
jgi:Holliday junction resolvase RusA-like endonuclease